jgi:[phosphatase 2A protein]-leucine-carboxy methyltransferase
VYHVLVQPCDLGSSKYSAAPSPLPHITNNVCTTNTKPPLPSRWPTISRGSRERSRTLYWRWRQRDSWWECSESQRSPHPIYRHRCCSVTAQRSFYGLSARSLRLFLCLWCRDSQIAHHKSRCVLATACRIVLLIHLPGTYTRTTALDILINAFLSHSDPQKPQTKQIVSLGAGTDTRYFRLRSQNKHHNLIYHEFDFPTVSETKRRTVLGNPLLSKLNENEIHFPDSQKPPPDQAAEWGFTQSKDGISETIYCCHPLDLRQLPYAQPTQPIHGLRTDIPTLIISECCLCYLEVDNSRDVVKWFADRIPSLGIILYEPIGVDDSFGQMMVANLAARGITMPSLGSYKTLSDQKARLGELGFREGNGGQEAENVEKIWEQWIPTAEKDRVDSLEGLDEVEEWQMLARHYAVVWGWRGSLGWEGWSGLRTTPPPPPS